MYYIIYKITNITDNKIYIGKHQTNNLDDGYMGSGKLLKRAINKHGLDKFQKEVLFIFNTEQEMNEKEKEIVTEEFVQRKDTYNICVGGKGGFSYINENQLLSIGQRRINAQKMHDITWNDDQYRLRHKIRMQNLFKFLHKNKKINYDTFTGKHHTEETKQKMSEIAKQRIGENHNQFGTMWITNGIENKKIKKDVDTIPEGWYKGRIIFQNEKKPKKERFCKYCKSVITQKYYLICETCRHTILEDYNNGMSEANLMKKYNWKSRQNITSFLDKSFPERSKTNKKRRKCSSGRMDYATDCNPVNIGSIPV